MFGIGFPGTTELIIVGVIGLLIFGRRLPDVARSIGRSIVEFKKGLRDVKDDVASQARLDSAQQQQPQNPSATPPSTTSEPPKQSASNNSAPE